VELLSAYPALVVGTVVGCVFARFGWRVMPLIAVGVAALAVATVYQTTVPGHVSEPWSGPITAPLWVLVAAVNAASWAFGIGIGVALDSTSSRHRIAPASRR
jgi:hypothetical protein